MTHQRRQALIAVLLLAAAMVLVWLKPLDAYAERSVEAGLKRALVTFASARALNAVLSALQEASVSFQIGAGVTVKPGAVLEPLDDVVEQFSNLMFAATASLAVQRLSIELFSWWPVLVVLSVLIAAWAMFAWRERPVPRWLKKITVALLIVRLAVPLFALLGEAAHWAILEGEYQRRSAQLSAVESQELKDAAGGAATGAGGSASESLVERMKRLLAQGADVARQVEALRTKATEVVENLIRLAAVFVVQTLVLPIVYLGFLFWLYRAITSEAAAPGAPALPRPPRSLPH